jgi:DNA-binding transcriptional regulator YbjK
MTRPGVSEITTNSGLQLTQLMDSNATVVTNSSAQPSVVVESSGVSSTSNGESVQEVEAAYERMKAELDEQRKRFFREEMAKLKLQAQQLARQRAASSLQESSRQMFSLIPSFETPVSSSSLSATPLDFQQGPTSTQRRSERHDVFEVAGRSYN